MLNLAWRATTECAAERSMCCLEDPSGSLSQHAEYYRDLFECAEGEAVVRLAREWLADYAREIDNLRSAFDLFTGRWRCCGGHRADGRRSTLWVNLSLIEECRYRIERALTTYNLPPLMNFS
jgi:predicted ATPase